MFEARTYGEIVTGNKDRVEPLAAAGISAAKLDDKQRALLWKLVETYARSFEPGLAEARLARAKQGGVEAIRFGWAGSTKRGGQHYYRVQGPLFLIEYDASQNDGNHIHTVWRDFNGDFGRDLLKEHYQAALGTRIGTRCGFCFFFFSFRSRRWLLRCKTPQVEAELVAERAALVPGEPLTVALRLKVIPGWHTYWRNPGDSGEPTRIEWQLPRGLRRRRNRVAGAERIPVGPLMNFGYDGEVLLLTRVVPPADLRRGQAGDAARQGELAGVRGALHSRGSRARAHAAGGAQRRRGPALGEADRRRARARCRSPPPPAGRFAARGEEGGARSRSRRRRASR